MTTYSTSFDSYTADAQPSDWTARWVTADNSWLVRSKAGVEGGKVLENTATVAGRHMLSWDTIDADANRANCEILARFRISASPTTDQIRLTVRGSGAAGAETGYSLLFTNSANSLRLHKFVAGVSTVIGSSISFTPVLSTWYWARLRANGTTIQFKLWTEGNGEPSTWTDTATDSSISAAGWVGVGGGTNVGGTRDFDHFSVGTNGDTAPLNGVSTSTEIRASQMVVEAALATVAQARVSQTVLEVALSAPIPGVISQMVVEVAFANVAAGGTQQPRMIVLI